MTLRHAIFADKDSFCEHLGNQAREHRELAASARTLRGRNRELGIAEGLEIALLAVRAWSLEEPPGSSREEVTS